MTNLSIEQRIAALREGKVLIVSGVHYKDSGTAICRYLNTGMRIATASISASDPLYDPQEPCTIYNPTSDRLREVIRKAIDTTRGPFYEAAAQAIESEFNITEKEK